MTPSSSAGEGPAPASRDPAPAGPSARITSVGGKAGGNVALPVAFASPFRPDLIQRAVDAARSHRRQPYGTSPTAGVRHSVYWSGKGKGVARTPRLMDSMRGAQAPNTVGGRPTHPPVVERIWTKKMNRQERQLAFASALGATRDPALAKARGHEVPSGLALPVVLEDSVEGVASSGDARALLEKLHLWADIARSRDGTHLRSGRGKRRGRVRRTPRSVLLVTSESGKARGFRNLAGVDVVPVQRLATEDLAPGGTAGRLTLFSVSAVESLRSRLGEGRR